MPIITSSGIGGTHCESMVAGPGVVTGRYGTIGEVFFITEDFWPLNTTLYVKDFHGNDPRFISYLLETIDFYSHSGKSGVPGVNRNDLHELLTPRPPFSEQRAIAAALSDVDALLAKLDQLIAKKRDLKQAAMQQLLTGQTRLPGFGLGSRFTHTDIGPLPDDWDICALRDVCVRIQDGTHFSPQQGDGEFLYVTSKNIGYGTLDVINAERISRSEHEKIYARCDVKKGDLLLTKDGANTGNAAINVIEEPISLLSSVAFLRFDDRRHIQAFFLHQILSQSGQRRVKMEMTGNAITRLTLQKIQSLRFPVPLLEEQTAIATVLSDMDAEIAALEARRDKTRLLKQGMMQELLTGRTRLL